MAWAWEHLANKVVGVFLAMNEHLRSPVQMNLSRGLVVYMICQATVRFNHFCLRWGHCAAYRIFLPLVTTCVTNSKQSLVFCKNGPLWPLWVSMAFWPPVTAVARMNIDLEWFRYAEVWLGMTSISTKIVSEVGPFVPWVLTGSWARPDPGTRPRSPTPVPRCAMQWLLSLAVASVAAALKTDASIQTSVPWDPLGTHWEWGGAWWNGFKKTVFLKWR